MPRTTAHASLLACALLGGLLTGCQAEYRSDARKLDALWNQGDYRQAATRAWDDAKEEARFKKNRVIYFLEAGRAAQVAGDYATSVEAFDHAFVDTFPYLSESPEATVSEAIVTTVGNDTLSIYRGTPNDRIMLHTLNALNFMAMGDMAAARVELNRAMLWQSDAEHRYARALELAYQRNAETVDDAAGEWEADEDDGWTADSAGVMHGNTAQILKTHYGDYPARVAWADYCTPFTWHLDGVFRLARSSDPERVSPSGGDRTSSSHSLKETVRRVPELVPLVHPDLTLAEAGGAADPTTWIYFMTGQAPELKEKRITMPLALAGGFSMPTLALPTMVNDDDMVPWLKIRTDESGSQRTHLLADTAHIAKGQFGERLPIIISQESIRATGKAVAAWVATHYASQQQNLAASLLALGAVVYQVGSAQADLRSWRTLPSQIQVGRIPTPPSGRVHLATPEGLDLGVHEVSGHEHNILVVSMPSAAAAASVMPIQLTGERTPWVAAFNLRADPNAPDTSDAQMAPDDALDTAPARPIEPGIPVLVAQAPSATYTDAGAETAPTTHALGDTPEHAQIASLQDEDAWQPTDLEPDGPAALTHATDEHPSPVDADHPMEIEDAAHDAPIEAGPDDLDATTPFVSEPDAEPDRTLEAIGHLGDESNHVASGTHAISASESVDEHERATAQGASDDAVASTAEPVASDALDTPPASPRNIELESEAAPVEKTRTEAHPPMPRTPCSVRAIKTRWAGEISDDAALQPLMEHPVKLKVTATGLAAWDNSSPVLMTTPNTLVRRQPAMLHADAMHAMAETVGDSLARRGFVGLSVLPACTAPDEAGHRELHLLVHMPVDADTRAPVIPEGLFPVTADGRIDTRPRMRPLAPAPAVRVVPTIDPAATRTPPPPPTPRSPPDDVRAIPVDVDTLEPWSNMAGDIEAESRQASKTPHAAPSESSAPPVDTHTSMRASAQASASAPLPDTPGEAPPTPAHHQPAPQDPVLLDASPADLPPQPARRAISPGPHTIKRIIPRWQGGIGDDAALEPLLETPLRLRARSTGLDVWDGHGSPLVTTPSALVRRRPALIHVEVMHAMADALRAHLERRGFVGLTVTPRCSVPDEQGQADLHLLVYMPVEGPKGPSHPRDDLLDVPRARTAATDMTMQETDR